MNAVKLDRLSALLEGLAPAVKLGITPDPSIEGPQGDQFSALQLYFLTRGAAALIANGDTRLIESPALVALHGAQPFVLHRFTSSDPCRLMVAQVHLNGPAGALFLEEFAQPRTISLRDDEPSLRLAVAMIESELEAPRCGQPALLDRVGDILFIGLLRYLVAHPAAHGQGLFNGLADARIAKALVAMHQCPGCAWNLEKLAQVAGMSRTAFATRFHAVMRRPPGKYLSALRLAIAHRAVGVGKGLKEAARLAGYENTSALSRALLKSRQRIVHP